MFDSANTCFNEFYNTYEPNGLVYVSELQCDEDTYKELIFPWFKLR